MKKNIFFILLLMVYAGANAKSMLIDKVPFCDMQPYIFYDMDSDGRKEKICTKPVGEKYSGTYSKFSDFFSHDVIIDFGDARYFLLSSRLLTQTRNAAFEDDTYIEVVNLSKIKHRLLKNKLKGIGLRKVHPFKSSVIYYWNKDKKTIEEYWESD